MEPEQQNYTRQNAMHMALQLLAGRSETSPEQVVAAATLFLSFITSTATEQ